MAYVVFERYEREKEPFIKLQTIKFRFAAVFGEKYLKPFEEVNKIMNDIFWDANRLRNRYWKDQGKKKNV